MEKVLVSRELLEELIGNYFMAASIADEIYDRCNGYEKDGLSDNMDEIEDMGNWIKEKFPQGRKEYI